VLVAARDAGGWSEKLDAYRDAASANVTAPDWISISRRDGTTAREMSPEAFGWAMVTQTFGFAGAVHHFLDRVRDRGTPLTAGADAVKPSSSSIASSPPPGSPPRSNPDGVWSSHAKK
jgi:virulence factor